MYLYYFCFFFKFVDNRYFVPRSLKVRLKKCVPKFKCRMNVITISNTNTGSIASQAYGIQRLTRFRFSIVNLQPYAYNRTLVECVIDVSNGSHVRSCHDVGRKYGRDSITRHRSSLQIDQVTYVLLKDKRIIHLKRFQPRSRVTWSCRRVIIPIFVYNAANG